MHRSRSQLGWRAIVALAMPVALAGSLALPRAAWAAPGDLDPTFGSGGKVVTDFLGADDTAQAVLANPGGGVLAVGRVFNGSDWDAGVARYGPDGALDATFGDAGRLRVDKPDGALDAVLGTGSIVLVGPDATPNSFPRNRITEISLADGTSSTFLGGVVDAAAVVAQPDGKVVVAGDYQGSFVLERYRRTEGGFEPGAGGR